MKKRILAIILAMLLMPIMITGCSDDNGEVYVNNEEITTEYEPEDDITELATELPVLTPEEIPEYFYMAGYRIDPSWTYLDFRGIDMVNLTELYLSENQITDISALSELANLEELYLESNQISDISILAGLINLKGLSIGANPIADISVLFGLLNLERLWLTGVSISDEQLAELREALPNAEITTH